MVMYIGNVEGDELIMQIAMSVGKRKYSLQFPSGFKYPLHGRYRENGRFSRKSVERALAKLGRAGEVCEVVLDIDYEGKEELAVMLLNREIKKLYYLTKCDRLDFYVGDGDTNFRFKSAITQPYKGGREEKPPIVQYLKDYLIGVHGAILATGYEADDMLGIHQTENTIAIHCDKDINMIPGRHWNTMRNEFWGFRECNNDRTMTYCGKLNMDGKDLKGHGLAFFYAQMLLGDRTDNISNLRKGMGDKTVYNILAGCQTEEDYLRTVVEEFKSSGLIGEGGIMYPYRGAYSNGNVIGAWMMSWQDRLYEQADLVWICRNREEKGSDYIKRKIEEYNI